MIIRLYKNINFYIYKKLNGLVFFLINFVIIFYDIFYFYFYYIYFELVIGDNQCHAFGLSVSSAPKIMGPFVCS